MAKRAKTVFKTEMVAHVWAQQSQEYGRNHGNFYFRGPTIYSYGSHFPIAKFVERKGKKAVLFTTRSYSNSTSKHIAHTRGALRGLDVQILDVHNPGAYGEPISSEVKRDGKKALDAQIAAVYKARRGLDVAIRQCQEITERANALSKFYGWRWRLKVPPFDEARLAKQRASNVLAAEREALKRAAQQAAWEKNNAERMIKDAEQREAWLRGDPVQYPYSWSHRDDTLLRVHGDLVQTSRGAEVPVEHAKRLWPVITKVIERGTPYQHNGHSEHVGDFVVDRIDVTGDMKVGCHLIKFDQVQKIARELHLI